MTKAAVIMLTKYLAAHYAKYNVNAISPGGVMKSNKRLLSNYSNRTPAGRLAKESDLLPALEYLISDENVYTNGHNLVVDGVLPHGKQGDTCKGVEQTFRVDRRCHSSCD